MAAITICSDFGAQKKQSLTLFPLFPHLFPMKGWDQMESISVLEYKIVRHLSSFEKKVFELFNEGKKYTEIAEELHKSPKSIDNALQRIKTKLNQTLLELE